MNEGLDLILIVLVLIGLVIAIKINSWRGR